MEFIKSPLGFIIFSIAGCFFAVAGSLVSGAAYRGKEGERYSPLNHFISELGEVGVSRRAWAFNIGLILSGLCLVLASLSLGLMINTILSKIAMWVGVLSALSLAMVGVFPMNKIKPHTIAAVTYFRSGLVMVILFSLAIGLQNSPEPVLSPWFFLAGLPPMMAFGGFLTLMGKTSQAADEPLGTQGLVRPKVWKYAIVEWSIFAAVVLWFLLIALGLRAALGL